MSTQSEAERDTHTALGAELRAARERRGLSLHQASQELHIGDAILDALERGDYSTLGAPIFVRGHLRGYARLLGLGEEEVLARYEQQQDKPAPPPLVTQKLDSGMRRASPWIFSLLVAVALCVLAVAWWMHRDQLIGNQIVQHTAPVATTTSRPMPVPLQSSQPATPPVGEMALKNPAPAAKHAAEPPPVQVAANLQRHVNKPVVLPLPSAAHATVSAVQKPAAQQAGSGERALTRVEFVLNQASWIEVYDASGKRLYYDLAPAGENVHVSGAGPLQVFLGNSPGVSIQLDGKQFNQTPFTRADNTARFRLGGAQADTGQAG